MITGIDLGTSTSQIAFLKDNKPKVIENPYGNFSTPSIVAYTADGEWLFGETAKAQSIANSKWTIIEAKRAIGDNSVQYIIGSQSFTPKEILSKLIVYLRLYAEKAIENPIDSSIITVPAYFSSLQRQEIKQAASSAGLEYIRLINEPTAAAIAYGLYHLDEKAYGLVYDFGGGTFDVTILELYKGTLEVLASSGDNKLGGKDIDELIINELKKEFEKQYNKPIQDDLKALTYLKQASENAKIELSNKDSTIISIPFLTLLNNKPVSIEFELSREHFSELIKPLLSRTYNPICKALDDSRLKKKDITFILLVGGTTRIPVVRSLVSEFFNKEPLGGIDPELAVVEGAAIQSGLVTGSFDNEDGLIVTDVCPYALGTAAVLQTGNKLIDGYLDILIEGNSTIPKTVIKIYQTVYDNQESVRITAYQRRHDCDSNLAKDHIFLGDFILNGIPKAKAGSEEVKISFSYNLEGILEVEGMIISTGERKILSIKNPSA